jgi:hypothetical protein
VIPISWQRCVFILILRAQRLEVAPHTFHGSSCNNTLWSIADPSSKSTPESDRAAATAGEFTIAD